MPELDIHFNEFEAVSLAMSKEATRYYLCGIFVTSHNGQARLVATDGHRMHIIDTQQPYNGASVILPDTFVKQIIKLRKGEPKREQLSNFVLHIGEDMATAEYKGSNHVSKYIDGTYPQYEKVIPTVSENVECSALGFNALYMADFGKAAKLCRGSQIVRVTPTASEHSPFLIDFGDYENFTGVLMPCRF